MRTVALILARMDSSRLPGKVLARLGRRTMLARVVRRVARAARVDEVVVATTTRPTDDAIVEECRRLSIGVSRGKVRDVLDRCRKAAEEHAADRIVRVTADCPLVDPEIIDRVVEHAEAEAADYACVVPGWSYPRGLDAELLARPALEVAWRLATSREDREHVTPFVYRHPEMFRLAPMGDPAARTVHRWTVDTAEDLAFVRRVCARLGPGDDFSWRDVLALVECDPKLAALNRHVPQRRLKAG
jgi:spore coat polysaccharide biosynthesis protein SpsF